MSEPVDTQAGDDGKPFIVVGGHAVDYWAKLYLSREPRLRQPGVIRWAELIPNTVRQLSYGPHVQSALRQLSG
jgi:hypothetical protein